MNLIKNRSGKSIVRVFVPLIIMVVVGSTLNLGINVASTGTAAAGTTAAAAGSSGLIGAGGSWFYGGSRIYMFPVWGVGGGGGGGKTPVETTTNPDVHTQSILTDPDKATIGVNSKYQSASQQSTEEQTEQTILVGAPIDEDMLTK